MAGTSAGAVKAAVVNKQKHGEDFYVRIGAMGGKALVRKGFAANIALAKEAGAMGGRLSKRGPSEARRQKAEEAKQMKQAGKTIPEIAGHFGVSYTTVYNYLKG